MAGNIEYDVPTWNQIYEMLLCQAQEILAQGFRPDIVVGIARGGLIPARIIADLLETSEFATIQIEFYVGINQTKAEPTLKHPTTTRLADKRVLLVDDIADSGESLKLAETYLQQQGTSEVKTATLYLKTKSITTPDFYEKQTTNWVMFPWDTKETLRKIIQKTQGKRFLNQEVVKLVNAGLPKQLAEKLLKDML